MISQRLAAVKINPGRNVAAAPQASSRAGTIMITTTRMTRILLVTRFRLVLGNGTNTSRASPPKVSSRPINAATVFVPARDGNFGTTTRLLAGASTEDCSTAAAGAA